MTTLARRRFLVLLIAVCGVVLLAGSPPAPAAQTLDPCADQPAAAACVDGVDLCPELAGVQSDPTADCVVGIDQQQPDALPDSPEAHPADGTLVDDTERDDGLSWRERAAQFLLGVALGSGVVLLILYIDRRRRDPDVS